MLVDTHCHLDAPEFAPDVDEVLSRAISAGVERFILPSVDLNGFATVGSLVGRWDVIRPAYGIHPMYVDQAEESHLLDLDRMLDTGRAVAVGEIGLDFFVEPRNEAKQLFYFAEQLKLARKHDLPVILHVRRSIDAVLRELRRIGVPGGIAHAFNGSPEQAAEFIKLGFCLGFGGAMTWPRALRIRKLAATLPEAAIVLETDAPDIPPVWIGRGRNAPGELPAIASCLAELRGVSRDRIAAFTTANACRVLPLLMDGAPQV